MDVMMYYQNDWIYSPYFTRYFNHDLTYKELIKAFNSEYPIVFSNEYKHTATFLGSKKTFEIYFLTDAGDNFSNNLIRFRFTIVNRSDDCKTIYSSPFYFKKTKW